jgi:hypothetical protein
LLDGLAKGKKKKRIGLTAIKKACSNWRMWVHFLITLTNDGPERAFDTYFSHCFFVVRFVLL